jgi:hypothetical protein
MRKGVGKTNVAVSPNSTNHTGQSLGVDHQGGWFQMRHPRAGTKDNHQSVQTPVAQLTQCTKHCGRRVEGPRDGVLGMHTEVQLFTLSIIF